MSLSAVGFGPAVHGQENLAATGTDQATAYQIVAQESVFTTVASGTGCRLPWASGATISVYNLGANDLSVYPGSGDQIGSGSVNAPITVSSGDSAVFTCLAAPTSAIPRRWYQQASGGGGGGGSAAGPAGTVQMSDGAGGFVVSDFSDLLTVPGSATANLVDAAGLIDPQPGLELSGPPGGDGNLVFAVKMTGPAAGSALVEYQGFGQPPGIWFATAAGTPDAPTAVTNGFPLGNWFWDGWTGTGYDPGAALSVTAQSDFSGTPTSSIDLTNASTLGLHIAADGTFSVDHGVVAGTDTQTAVAGAATTTQPNVIVTSEALVAQTSYALTLTSPFIETTSVIQVTAMNSASLVTWPVSIVCSSGSAVITVGMASLTGTVVMNISVNN